MNIEDKIEKNKLLSNLTTLRMGGLIKYYLEVSEKDDLKEILELLKKKEEKYFILGGGSNILANDKEYDGYIIKMSNDNIVVKGERVECGAGSSLIKTIHSVVSESLEGIEWAAGIPGTIGGAIRGNVGAFGNSISDIVEMVEVYDINKKEFKMFSRNDCQFNYRDSIFKKDKNLIVWRVTLRLKKGDVAKIKEIVSNNLFKRNESQPKLPSAGCVFENFIAGEVKENNIQLYKLADNQQKIINGKIAAGWIISELGLKGKKIGDVKVSLEHANFIVNTNVAKAEEFIMMISYIKTKVRDEFKLQLKEEIEYLGFD